VTSPQICPSHVKCAPVPTTRELKATPYNVRLVSYRIAVTEQAPFKGLCIFSFYHCPLLQGTTLFWIPI